MTLLIVIPGSVLHTLHLHKVSSWELVYIRNHLFQFSLRVVVASCQHVEAESLRANDGRQFPKARICEGGLNSTLPIFDDVEDVVWIQRCNSMVEKSCLFVKVTWPIRIFTQLPFDVYLEILWLSAPHMTTVPIFTLRLENVH